MARAACSFVVLGRLSACVRLKVLVAFVPIVPRIEPPVVPDPPTPDVDGDRAFQSKGVCCCCCLAGGDRVEGPGVWRKKSITGNP